LAPIGVFLYQIMSDFLDEVASDCVEAETDLGAQTVTWNGAIYPVASTLVRRGAVLVIGGKEVEIKLSLRVRYTGTRAGITWELTTLPKQGERVIYKSITYRIAQVIDAHGAFVELDLAEINR